GGGGGGIGGRDAGLGGRRRNEAGVVGDGSRAWDRGSYRPLRIIAAGGGGGGASPGARPLLNVEVEGELVRVWAQPDGIDLVLPLVVDPRLDDVRREDVALEQPVVRLLEIVEDDVERARQLLDLLRLGGRQLVEILVD